MCFSPYLGIGCGGGGGALKGLVHNLLMLFFTLGSSKIEITSKRVVRSSAGGTPKTPPFWGDLCTIPQGMVPDVQPLVKSSFQERK